MKLSGAWRPIYVVTAMTSLYLNIFVLVTQAFLKVPALHALAPERAAKRAAIRGHPGHRAGVFCHCDHRRVEAISAGVIGPIRAVSNEMAVNPSIRRKWQAFARRASFAL